MCHSTICAPPARPRHGSRLQRAGKSGGRGQCGSLCPRIRSPCCLIAPGTLSDNVGAAMGPRRKLGKRGRCPAASTEALRRCWDRDCSVRDVSVTSGRNGASTASSLHGDPCCLLPAATLASRPPAMPCPLPPTQRTPIPDRCWSRSPDWRKPSLFLLFACPAWSNQAALQVAHPGPWRALETSPSSPGTPATPPPPSRAADRPTPHAAADGRPPAA